MGILPPPPIISFADLGESIQILQNTNLGQHWLLFYGKVEATSFLLSPDLSILTLYPISVQIIVIPGMGKVNSSDELKLC